MPELSTVRLNIALHGAVSGANVVLELDRYEVDNGIQVPTRYTTTVDDNGKASIDVWPNARGSRSSVYNVHITRHGQPLVRGTIALPNVDAVDLHDYLESPPYPERPAYQSALIEIGELAASAQDNAATADRRAGDAESAATRSESAETSATASASAASQSALSAGESQAAAASSARDAGSSATRAATSATKATEAADSASDDAAATAQDREAVASDRKRTEAAADQTAGLTSWESDGRVLTTSLPVASPSIARSDLPNDAPDGARVYVPDCPQPVTSIIDGFGAECIRSAGRWVRLGDYGDIYTPLDQIIGSSGMYTRVRQSVLYRDTARKQPVVDTPQTAALIADESPARLDFVQPVVSRQADWSGGRLTVDGSDDGYATSRPVESSHDAPLFVALGLRRISGVNNYDIISYIPASSGISARVGTRFGGRIYYGFDDVATGSSTGGAFINVDLDYKDVFAIAFQIDETGIYIVVADGSLMPIDYRDFVMPTEWQSSAVVKFFGGQPNAHFFGAAVCTRPLDQAQRAAIIKYVTGNRS